jgi:hypothetical protein
MAKNSDDFVMSFDPKTIQHLGIRMYSNLPPVISELIANSYDADAENVFITLLDSGNKKEIIVEDDGLGMTFTELNDKFLRIGRNRRDEEGIQKTPKGRKIIGKKGLGKLSFFGVAHEVEVYTKKNGKQNSFSMNWDAIKDSVKPEYNPKTLSKDQKCSDKEHGTKIVLKDIKRETDFNPESLADGVSRTFIVDPDFKITITHNSEEPIFVSNERKYNNLNKEVEWEVPKDIQGFGLEYENQDKIIGRLFTTELPISPKTNMKGITLFSRKKLVNAPEYFSDSTSSHIFSYLTGWLEVDFIDDLDEDVISTNRQSLNWDHPEMNRLRDYLSNLINKIERDWRIKRGEVRKEKLSNSTGINIDDWVSKLPDDVKENVNPIINTILRNVESTEETKDIHNKLIKYTHSLAPEYTYWHYRHLHPEIQGSAKENYEGGDYYRAFQEAIKRYVNNIRQKVARGSLNSQDYHMLKDVFGMGPKSKLKFIPDKYLRPDGSQFNDATKQSILSSQLLLSQGASAGENPLSHEEFMNIKNSGLFTEKDCLDLLSILSHLSKRLDDFEEPQVSSAN